MKNFFELAADKKQEDALRRIKLRHTFSNDRTRCFVAGELYEATYGQNLDYFTTGERPIEEVMERFCQSVFGASYKEVIKSFDNYLG